jgi:hypothetical protein
MALKRIAIPSPFVSSRGGTRVRLIVLHTAEGARTIESLGSWFQNPTANVSSHTGADDKPNTVGEYVQRQNNAWTQGNANPYSVSIELCAFAKWTPAEWAQHPNMLANCAAWIAEEAAALGIPIVRASAQQAQSGGTGVCQHVDLGAAGGGHWDCGGGFPMDQVISMAKGGSASIPAPTPEPETQGDENMILVDPVTGGTWCIASKEGAVYTVGKAPYCGATNNTAMNAGKYPCCGIGLRPNNDGYRIVLDWGAGKGDQSKDGTGPRFRTYDFPRNGSAAVNSGTY